MVISFSERYFKSQKELQIFIKSIVEQCNFFEIMDEKHKFFGVFIALLSVHFNRLEKEGPGVKHFYFSPNIYGHKELQICRLDDSVVSMSCCYAKIIKDRNPYQELRAAMRNSVSDQIMSYRRNQQYPYYCVMCLSEIKLFQIDHIYPFSKLAQEFLNETDLTVPDRFKKNHYNMLEFYPEDKKFKGEWDLYHKKRATYQILCIHCNIKKSDKIINEQPHLGDPQ